MDVLREGKWMFSRFREQISLISWWFPNWYILRCIYSMKSLYNSLYNDKMLFKLYCIYFLFDFCNCSYAVLPSIFCCSNARVAQGKLVHVFLISYSRAGWCFQARAWVLNFWRLCSFSFVYEFHHFTIRSTDDSLFDIISCNAYYLRCIFSEKSVWLVVKWQNVV